MVYKNVLYERKLRSKSTFPSKISHILWENIIFVDSLKSKRICILWKVIFGKYLQLTVILMVLELNWKLIYRSIFLLSLCMEVTSHNWTETCDAGGPLESNVALRFCHFCEIILNLGSLFLIFTHVPWKRIKERKLPPIHINFTVRNGPPIMKLVLRRAWI